MRAQTASVGSRTVRYLESGAGSPLVLLHAFPLSADMWRPQLEQPPRGRRVLAPDLRGFGPPSGQHLPGDPPAHGHDPLTLAEMADDVIEWLDVLGIERAAIGGLSMGGYLTFALFRRAPGRFTSVILANTKATADSADARAARDEMSALVRAAGPSAVADQMLPKLLGETSRKARPHLAPALRALIEANRAEGIDAAIQALKGRPDSTDLLPSIVVPALVIAGDEDAIIPLTESERMHALLPRSQYVVLQQAGHVSNMETPQEFSEALWQFLQIYSP